MARVVLFLALVAVAVGAALVLISERAAITRLGYEVAELERTRTRLTEARGQLEAGVARLKAANEIRNRIESLNLDLVPPEERLEEEKKGSSKGPQ